MTITPLLCLNSSRALDSIFCYSFTRNMSPLLLSDKKECPSPPPPHHIARWNGKDSFTALLLCCIIERNAGNKRGYLPKNFYFFPIPGFWAPWLWRKYGKTRTKLNSSIEACRLCQTLLRAHRVLRYKKFGKEERNEEGEEDGRRSRSG